MTDKQIKELAIAIQDARRMLEIGDTDEAQNVLDHAAGLIPIKFWPVEITEGN